MSATSFASEPYCGSVSLAPTTAGAINFGSYRFRKGFLSVDQRAYLTYRFGAVGDTSPTSLSTTAAAGNAIRLEAGFPFPIQQLGGAGQYLNLYNLSATDTIVVTVTAGPAD